MGALDLVLGPMVTGTAISTFLCGLMTTQCYTYYRNYPSDPTWMKYLVIYFLITDFLHTGTEVAIVYRYTVTLFGNMKEIFFADWLFATIPVMSVIISTPAQAFFAWRVARLTRIRLIGIAIFIFAVVQLLCGIGVTIAVTRIPAFLEFQKFQAVVITWLVSSVVCDILITTSLVWYLQTNKSGISATDDLVTKLIRSTVNTGAITALWAILDLVIFLTEDNSLHLLFNFPLAKIYTNSLLSTLNSRRSQVEGVRAAAGLGSSGGSIPRKATGSTGTVTIPTWDRGYAKKNKETIGTGTTSDTYTHRTTIHPEFSSHSHQAPRYVDPMYSAGNIDEFDLPMQGKTDGDTDIEMNIRSQRH